jgi:hypothetical protein
MLRLYLNLSIRSFDAESRMFLFAVPLFECRHRTHSRIHRRLFASLVDKWGMKRGARNGFDSLRKISKSVIGDEL